MAAPKPMDQAGDPGIVERDLQIVVLVRAQRSRGREPRLLALGEGHRAGPPTLGGEAGLEDERENSAGSPHHCDSRPSRAPAGQRIVGLEQDRLLADARWGRAARE
jgi:hypothetical protein